MSVDPAAVTPAIFKNSLHIEFILLEVYKSSIYVTQHRGLSQNIDSVENEFIIRV